MASEPLDLEAAQKRAREALDDLHRVEDAIREYRRSANEEFRSVQEAHDRAVAATIKSRWGEARRAAAKARDEAQAAFDRLKAETSTAKERPWPVGTVMVEYKSDRYVDRPMFRRLTGKRGVIEVITPESEHPGRKRWGLAQAGDVVVRLLKKDGKPGAGYVAGYERNHWVPEGTDLATYPGKWPEAMD